ncbi:uncharacterized protein [Musca autumnalis]|uniref:uncharacterized protein n=1 Tax=Musca autumnalis TaxID=221902 RepID=UPI003CE6F29D
MNNFNKESLTSSSGSSPQQMKHSFRSVQTLSIQNLQFPYSPEEKAGGVNKPPYKVKCQKNLHQQVPSKSSGSSKERGYDFTSSTNSNYRNALFSVPKKFRAKCPSSSEEKEAQQEEFSYNQQNSKDSLPKRQSNEELTTSQKLYDSQHALTEKPQHLKGPEWRKPCSASFVPGVQRKFIGHCPPNIEQIAKMSKTRQKFFLTQDPRKTHCLVNPETFDTKAYSKEKEFQTLTQMVKYGQNTCSAGAGVASEASEDSFICEVIDLENPLKLDFQGLDYKNTYQQDEQDLQNQRNYRQMERYMERRRVKKQTQLDVDEELHQERLRVPRGFDVRDRDPPRTPTPPPEPIKLGKIFRSAEKSENQVIIEMEKQRRGERYRDLYLRKRQREEQQTEEAKQRLKNCQENMGLITAERHFQDIAKKANEVSKRALKREEIHKEADETLKEETKVKSKAEGEEKMARTPSKSKGSGATKGLCPNQRSKEVAPNVGIVKPEHHLKVGKDGSKFMLRGQILVEDPSKIKESEAKKCLSRDQWLKELAPKRLKVKPDVEIGLKKSFSPDDPNLILFQPKFGHKPPKAETSAVKEFRQKPLGRHYDRVLRKPMRFMKPRLRYNVKKFNLVGYRYGDTAKHLERLLKEHREEKFNWKSIDEFIANREREEQRRLQEMKLKRLQLMGIPCRPWRRTVMQRKCEDSESGSDADWIPEKEKGESGERYRDLRKIMPVNRRCNMPAPRFREPTLRQHPQRPRDYEGQRVPSEIFDEVVKTTTLPFMYRLPSDIVDLANAGCSEKRPYSGFLESRHHHDHWNPTQNKYVDVHYQPEIVRPEITEIPKKSQGPKFREDADDYEGKFLTAHPPCAEYVDKNLTMPEWDVEELMEDFKKQRGKDGLAESTMGTLKIPNLCHENDFISRSRDPQELEGLDYPGRREYLEFLKEIKEAIGESKASANVPEPLLEELQEDLKSIETCLTSLSSSQCTNLTNDSGSYLLMEGQEKIPLDFIRKSLVPFEELQRSRFQAEPIDVEREENNPFRVLPFSGQKKAQLELTRPRDKFFTFNSRLRNGLRLRLQVPTAGERGKEANLIGKGSRKYPAMVATDIDENYVNVVSNRPAVKMFNYKSARFLIKDALRLKFESMVIQDKMVHTKIYDRLNEQHWSQMEELKMLYDKLFDKWEKAEYDASMAVVYKVKAFYDQTDQLKTQLKAMERDQTALNMDIVFTEAHWVRCIMLQNFHYLLGDHEWRLKHDWIHRLTTNEEENSHVSSSEASTNQTETSEEPEIQLENYEDSILKRSKVNIRQRDKDDAWAIKQYYEEVYLPNKHPNLIVFPNPEAFLQGVEQLKAKTFVLLLEMHFTLAIHTELQNKLETFEEWCSEDLREKREYVSRKCSKLYFMQDRAAWLRSRALIALQRPIEESYNDESFLRDYGLISEAWRRIVPSNVRGSNEQLEAVEMVAMISDVVMELIAKFETIPMEESSTTEQALRRRRNYLLKQSQNACHIERRIAQEMQKVRRNLEPARKTKRPSKLPRLYLKKRQKTLQIAEKKISERAKFFFQAFHEDDADILQPAEVRDSIAQVDAIQEQIVPFYFDHFLKLNGYTPNYNFKTQIEMRDGPELDRLKVRSVVPEIQERLMQWEQMKRKIMEDHIAQNPKMYIDVV